MKYRSDSKCSLEHNRQEAGKGSDCSHIRSCFILSEPEYWEVILQGTPEQKELAAKNLRVASDLRTQRAVLGNMPAEFTLSVGQKTRMIYDANNRRLVLHDLPGKLIRKEGDENDSGDTSIDNVYKYAGITFDFYMEVFSRISIDNNYMPIVVTANYDRGFDNAFWNGQQMVFGDGGGQAAWNDPTEFLDIMGHELTHGVIDKTADLEYRRQSGALNESIADIMASCIKQRFLGQSVETADWLIADGIYKTPRAHGTWLRSLKNPSLRSTVLPGMQPFKLPGHMDDFVQTDLDDGGVHINSGIPNKAFCIAAMEIGGNAWEKAGVVWYRTLLEKLHRTSQFIDAATGSIEVAGELYGKDSKEQEAVRKGWSEVGVYK
jgi:Zn-dependent metalloprotease